MNAIIKYFQLLCMASVIAMALVGFSSFTSASVEVAPFSTTESMYGEVKIWMGYFEPQGWRFCDGRAIVLEKNSKLHDLYWDKFGENIDYGDIYNSADDKGTFNLPNLESKRIVDLGVTDHDYYNNVGKYIICTYGKFPVEWDWMWVSSHYNDGMANPWNE